MLYTSSFWKSIVLDKIRFTENTEMKDCVARNLQKTHTINTTPMTLSSVKTCCNMITRRFVNRRSSMGHGDVIGSHYNNNNYGESNNSFSRALLSSPSGRRTAENMDKHANAIDDDEKWMEKRGFQVWSKRLHTVLMEMCNAKTLKSAVLGVLPCGELMPFLSELVFFKKREECCCCGGDCLFVC